MKVFPKQLKHDVVNSRTVCLQVCQDSEEDILEMCYLQKRAKNKDADDHMLLMYLLCCAGVNKDPAR